MGNQHNPEGIYIPPGVEPKTVRRPMTDQERQNAADYAATQPKWAKR